MVTPGGWQMSVALTNCGQIGWVTDRTGYRYDAIDPVTGQPWPEMPQTFTDLAAQAAEVAGFSGLRPDACLVNRYAPGARLSLHQDCYERDFDQPIVSVSLGFAGHLPLGRQDARRQAPAHSADPRRRRGLGRAGPPDVPWRPFLGRGRAPADRHLPLQPHLQTGALNLPARRRAAGCDLIAIAGTAEPDHSRACDETMAEGCSTGRYPNRSAPTVAGGVIRPSAWSGALMGR